MYRQGDVLLTRITSLPNEVKKQENDVKIILAYGEATGHHHYIEATKETNSFIDSDGNLFLDLEKDSVLIHQEHSEIIIPRGKYQVTIQREYSPEEIIKVND